MVSVAIKEALEETRDAVATCPFASRPSLTTTPSRLFVTINSSRVRAVPRMVLRSVLPVRGGRSRGDLEGHAQGVQ